MAVAFEDQFGIRPLEGYGCTECSPVVTVNGKDYRAPGFRQVAAKRGKIGHPLPGVSVKVVDIETGQPVAPGNSGMLLVKGPNVMRGYLGKPEKTAEVLHDGWYTTGDVGMIEEDGFVTITDRLSRFSKIGGEMVPHIRIEEKLHELADATEQVFAVTAVPDEKKGERIIVIHTLPEAKLTAVLEKLSQCDLPALWKPKANQFVHVDSIPTLGTGKMDLRAIRALATHWPLGLRQRPKPEVNCHGIDWSVGDWNCHRDSGDRDCCPGSEQMPPKGGLRRARYKILRPSGRHCRILRARVNKAL